MGLSGRTPIRNMQKLAHGCGLFLTECTELSHGAAFRTAQSLQISFGHHRVLLRLPKLFHGRLWILNKLLSWGIHLGKDVLKSFLGCLLSVWELEVVSWLSYKRRKAPYHLKEPWQRKHWRPAIQEELACARFSFYRGWKTSMSVG